MAKVKGEEKPAVRTADALGGILAHHDLRGCLSPASITVTDLEGNIVDCNEATLRIHGYASREELIGKSALSFIAKGDHERAVENLMKTLQQGSVRDLEYALLTRDGREFPAELSANVIRDSSGRPVGFVAITKDISERKVMEEDLRDAKEKWLSLTTNTDDIIMIVDSIGVIQYINKTVPPYTPEETIGRTVYEYVPKEQHEVLRESLNKVFTTGKPDNYEISSHIPQTGTHWFDTKVVPVKHNGRVVDIIMISTPITERKLMEEELKKRAQLLDAAIDSIVLHDVDGSILYVNEAFCKMRGLSRDKLMKMNLFSMSPPESAGQTTSRVRELMEKEEATFETGAVREDGSIIPVEVHSRVIESNGRRLVLSVARDITERKKLEEMKNRFISVATHELRTPLVSIKGYVDYILTGKLGAVPENVKPSLEVVQRNTDRLLRITDDLLDIQRLASGRLPLYVAPLSFREVLDDCAKAVQPLFDERKQSLHLEAPDSPLLIQGDRIRLSQVVMNVLSNAVKFTPQGGEITVRVEDKEDTIQVQVSDTGIGIRKEDLERVFEPLADIKKPTYIKGTGLGLSVAKGLVEAHGGKMWACSEGEGKGSTFTFTLPKQKGKEAS